MTACVTGGSIFELAAAGLPAILVPYPYATADHQALNARWLVDGGAALMVRDDELDGATLRRMLDDLLSDPQKLAAMRENALRLAMPDAADRIADQLEAAAKGEQ